MSADKEDRLRHLCSKDYDPTKDSAEEFATAWNLLATERISVTRQVEESTQRLQELRTENDGCQTVHHRTPCPLCRFKTKIDPKPVAPSAPALSSALAGPASSKQSSTKLSESSEAPTPRMVSHQKRPVDELVQEIREKYVVLRRVRQDIQTEEWIRLCGGAARVPDVYGVQR